jgi:hypothetical protein
VLDDETRHAFDRDGVGKGACPILFLAEVEAPVRVETPIISIDSSFCGQRRSLLGRPLGVYGAAVKAAWLRVVARS